ncbi:MAG: hypothetical protein RLZZ116_2235, partial [Planctomycetota bacterium]
MIHPIDHSVLTTPRLRGAGARCVLAAVIASSFAGLAHAQTATGWGRNNFGQTNVPAGITNIVRMDCGLDHTVALRADSTVTSWGWNFWGQGNVPAGMGPIRAVAAGDWHSVAVNLNGQVFCWGDNFNGQCDIPPEATNVSAVSAGYQFSGALRADGTVVCWGRNVEGQCNVPAGLDRVVRVASGADHSIALRSDGTVVCWGRGDSGQTTVPVGLGTVKDVSAGHMHTIALQVDGTVVAWGHNFYGQRNVPAGLTGVVAIAAGGYHNLALKSDGSVVAWGAGKTNTGSAGNFGQSIVPTSIANVIDVDAGEYYSFVLSQAGGIVAPTITVVSTTDANCNSASGAIDITVIQAETVYWTGPSGFFSNAIDLTGLASGTYTATAIGVGGIVTQSVSIAGGGDTTGPVVSSHDATRSAAVAANCTALVPDFTSNVVASDNCTPSAQLQITQSPAAGTALALGSHTVSITVTDLAGNQTVVSATFQATGTQYTYYTDADADLYGTAPTTTRCSSSVPAGFAAQSGDCNDANALVNPGRTESCNAIDDNCNGLVDDGLATNTYFIDADDDGFGLKGSTGIVACSHPVGTATNSLDCNDQNAAINPLAIEVCDASNIDENCNTLADDLDPTTLGSTKTGFYRDADQDGFTINTPVRFCDMPAGYEAAAEGDCNDNSTAIHPGAVENCANDGTDNDCDGEANSDAEAVDSTSYYVDADQDTFGAGAATRSCTVVAARVTNNSDCDDTRLLYADGDLDTFGAGAPVACGVISNTDCNDAAATVYPGAPENCSNDGTDNDCDGEANSDAEATDSTSYYADADLDGFGTGAAVQSCTAVAGRVTNNSDCDDTRVLYADNDGDTFGAGSPAACGVVSSTDCNDASATIYPGAVENCANDGTDNDCDGEANADFESVDATAYHRDIDADGFGSPTSTAILSCTPLTGRVPNNSDCDDARVMYADGDADTFGAGPMIACNGVATNTDCNDASAAVYPGAAETCANDGTDNDCDGEANSDAEATDSTSYYVDGDQDGFGAGAATKSCTAIAGSVTNNSDCNDAAVIYADGDGDTFGAGPKVACNGVATNTDCNDASAAVYPGALENCANDGTDNDCDGEANSDAAATDSVAYYRDVDVDGFGAGAATMSCTAIAGSVTNSSDCDDTRVMYVDGDADTYGAGPMVACNGVSANGDCNDAAADIHPGAPEVCANRTIDNDCDGIATDDAEATDSTAYYTDGDRDTFGAGAPTMSCVVIANKVTNNSDCDDTKLLYADNDGDTFGAGAMIACGGVTSNIDCDDASATVYPGAAENCANAGIDNDCDGIGNDDAEATDSVSYYRDLDSDGFGAGIVRKSCTAIAGWVTNSSDCNDAAVLYADVDLDGFGAGPMVACNGVLLNTDCNDASAAVFPGAPERCANDGVDNDCDGEANSDAEATDSVAYYVDGDQDGFGAGAATKSCTAISGSVTNSSDCNDSAVLYTDADGDTFGALPKVACNGVSSSTDCNDSSATVFPGAPERCANDGTDNDCDGEANSDAEATDSVAYYVDGDADTFGAGGSTMSCTAIAGSVTNNSDCNDASATVFPGAPENCANDGTDNDCDGEANSDAEATDSVAYYVDGDSDAFGAGAATMSCTAIAGSVTNDSDCDDAAVMYTDADSDTYGALPKVACNGVSSSSDCNDSSASVFPGAPENCSNDGTDNDCDGEANSDAEAFDGVAYYVDGDQDGFGAGAATMSCTAIAGSVTNSSDCNDASATVFPGAPERCANDGTDNDCDGEANSDAEATDSIAYYIDGDSDAFGTGAATMSCTAIAGSVTNDSDCDDAAVLYTDADGDAFGTLPMVACNGVSSSTDCNDAAAAIHPSAQEFCNGVDDDCDGASDDGITFLDYYPDVDLDGFGDASATAERACQPVAGKVLNRADCNDSSADVYPAAPETCANDGLDNDCDGEANSDAEATDSVAYYVDGDSDAFGAGAATMSCTAIAGSVTNESDCDDAAVLYADVDGDTFGAGPMVACNGVLVSTDCNDASSAIFPGALENCANDGTDNDCDGEANSDAEAADSAAYYVDGDSDAFGAGAATMSCTAIAGSVTNASDCDDSAATVFPGALEDCANDGTDNDCDGEANADAEASDSVAYYVDGDSDGFGAGSAAMSCTAIAGSVTNSTDCDDAAVLYTDADGDTFGALPKVACNGVGSSSDCDDAAAAVFPGAPENCANDGTDNDCDGEANSDAEASDSVAYYVDGDSDGFGAGAATMSCVAIAGSVTNASDCDDTAVLYADADGDLFGAGPKVACNGVTVSGDCNDSAASVFPGAAEDCTNDGTDNDCDGEADADAEASDSVAYYRDADSDGFGTGVATMSCTASTGSVTNNSDCDDTKLLFADNDLDTHGAGSPVACGVASSDDCDDAAADIHPTAAEVCANRAIDNDCDGDTSDDEASDSVSYYRDSDNDGFGSGGATKSCVPVAGSVTSSTDCDDTKVLYVDGDQDGFGAGAPAACGVSNSTDCDDSSASVRPGAPENCANDGIDNDCDGEANSDAEASDSVAYFVDGDSDTFGAGGSTMSCTAIAGSVTNSTDCDDAAATVHPGADESCNATDDNCNGLVDDGVVFHTYYLDSDGDTFGSSADAGVSSCSPVTGRVANNTDCNDADAAIKPSAAETCNQVDDNCNGSIDDGLVFTDYFVDGDADGFGSSGSTAQSACAPVVGRVANSLDCNDSDASIKPGAAELCDLIDQDCDGQADDGLPTQDYYADADADTFGAANGTPIASCMPLAGRVLDHTDCNDASAAVRPGALENCANDGIDNDCDGEANSDSEASDSVAYYVDGDSDTYGAGAATMGCAPIAGSVTDN